MLIRFCFAVKKCDVPGELEKVVPFSMVKSKIKLAEQYI